MTCTQEKCQCDQSGFHCLVLKTVGPRHRRKDLEQGLLLIERDGVLEISNGVEPFANCAFFENRRFVTLGKCNSSPSDARAIRIYGRGDAAL